MSEKWSEFARQMADKEGWLAAHLEKEAEAENAPDGSCEAVGLYAAASLVRGALNAPEVPESAQSQSRAKGLTVLEQHYRTSSENPPEAGWFSRVGSWLQLAFNLFRRR